MSTPCSIRNLRSACFRALPPGAALAAAAAIFLAGCQSRPFADLARRSPGTPTAGDASPHVEPQPDDSRNTAGQMPPPPEPSGAAPPDSRLPRHWPVSIAYRPSGDVDAGNTYWPTIDEVPKRPEWLSGALESFEFLFNLAAAPVRLFITRPAPWGGMIYSPIGPAAEEHEEY